MRSLPFVIVLLLSLILTPLSAYTQTFPESAGHGETYRSWNVAETEHFLIIYPSSLEGIQNEAAAVAEAAHEALSANLEVVPQKKIRIYFTDMDEIMNGFAVPFRDAYTNIWVNVNRYADNWTGEAKWMRKVLAHELAHIYHFIATESRIRPLDFIFANPLPMDWTEGLAQYQTELWDSQRGDRWLRKSAFDDRLNTNDGLSPENRRLVYAAGNSKMRYFAETYGDTTLARILEHRKTLFLNFGKVHDFPEAFREVVGKSLDDFDEEWRKHINVYYNTMAGQMDRPDSLDVKPLSLGSSWYEHVRYAPDTSKIAVLAMPSRLQPVRTLSVVENSEKRTTRILARGPIIGPLSWSPDVRRIAYAQTARNRRGHLANDLFSVDVRSGKIIRHTTGRRAVAPVFSSDGSQLAFIGSNGSTDNIFLIDLATGAETRLTGFAGDEQIISLAWHHERNLMAISHFSEDGKRDILLLDPVTGRIDPFTDDEYDNRAPTFSPDGSGIAYISLRDHVPNIFYRTLEQPGQEERVTRQFTGAELFDWLPPDSTHLNGRLLVETSETKRFDRLYLIGADVRRPAVRGTVSVMASDYVASVWPDATAAFVATPGTAPAALPGNAAVALKGTAPAALPGNAAVAAQDHTTVVPPAYTAWTTHRPPVEIPKQVAPDPSLIQDVYPYRSFRNLTRAAILPYPFIFDEDDYGLGVSGAWVEPTGQHFLLGTVALSYPHVVDNSFFLFSYVNRRFYPTYAISLYKRSFSGRFYGSGFFFETLNGADVSGSIPLFLTHDAYIRSSVGLKFRLTDTGVRVPPDLPDNLAAADEGTQAELRFSWKMRHLIPHSHNIIHPLNGWGVQVNIRTGLPLGFTDSEFIRPDVSAYAILPAPGDTRFYLYTRGQMQFGSPFAQDYVGLARYDEIVLPFDDAVDDFLITQNERVRGFREYVVGEKMVFGSLEYRVPLLPSLQTTILGAVSFGRTTIAPFLDAGLVWNTRLEPGNDLQQRFGTGMELKNVLSLGGLKLLHSVGIAQPVQEFGSSDMELYYRVRATIAF